MPTDFRYVPTSGDLSGKSFEEQTEAAFNELGAQIDSIEETANNAVDISNDALLAATDAVGTANQAATTASNAAVTANNALDVANNASSGAASAEARANEAFDLASNALTESGQAKELAENADTKSDTAIVTSEEARTLSYAAEQKASDAVQAIEQAVGVYVKTEEQIDADDFGYGPYRMLVMDALSENLPGDAPWYFTVFTDDQKTYSTQFVWSQTQSGLYRRTGILAQDIVPGSSSLTVNAVPAAGAVSGGTFTVTASDGTPLSAVFTPGSFTEQLADVFNVSGVISFTLDNFSDGNIVINGISVILISGGVVTLETPDSISFDNGYVRVSNPQLTDSAVSFSVTATWVNVTGAIFGEWELLGGGVPTGCITMWSGTVGDIPSGWSLCDGQNGTPDLCDRFIIGAGLTYAPNDSGGSAAATTGDTTLTKAQMPAHVHRTTKGNGGVALSDYFSYTGSASNQGTSASGMYSEGGGEAHNHSVSLPPYYALAFIIKL